MRKKILLPFFLLILLQPLRSAAQMPDSVKSYIDTALSILKNNSLYAGRLNWDAIQKNVYEKAATASTNQQTMAALTYAFTVLGDKHAAYYQYDDAFRLPDSVLESRYDDSIKAAWKKGPSLKDTMLGNMACINVPFMGVNKQADIDWYANWLYNAVARLAAQKPKGWIIDLRLNGGGNIRPMMQGLAIFFNDGILSYYIDSKGNATDEASIKDGNFLIGGQTQASIKSKIPSIANAKVAVLIGPGTASSGEGVATNFKQRKNTRLFGEQTAGRANSTQGFVFNNDQSYFLISTAFIADKNKIAQPEYVTPHQTIPANNAFSNPAADKVVQAAIKWLKQ